MLKVIIYDNVIGKILFKQKNIQVIYETIGLRYVQNAADEFKISSEKTRGKDGLESMDGNSHWTPNFECIIK